MILQNASHNGTAETVDDSDFFEGVDELLKQFGCPLETGESQHIRTNDPEQFPCDAAEQLPVSDLSQKDPSNKKERKRKRNELNDERK